MPILTTKLLSIKQVVENTYPIACSHYKLYLTFFYPENYCF